MSIKKYTIYDFYIHLINIIMYYWSYYLYLKPYKLYSTINMAFTINLTIYSNINVLI